MKSLYLKLCIVFILTFCSITLCSAEKNDKKLVWDSYRQHTQQASLASKNKITMKQYHLQTKL